MSVFGRRRTRALRHRPGRSGPLPPPQDTWPQLDYADTPEEAAARADAVLVLTEWRQYRELDPVAFEAVVGQKRVLDGRDALNREAWTAAGWTYRALDRRAG